MTSWSSRLFRTSKPPEPDLLGDARRVMSASLSVEFDFARFAGRHIFNHLSQGSEYGFYYFPYGYLFRYPRWGTINEMGFRFKENLPEAARLYEDHYRIVFYGGSTGFDILVPDEDTLCAKLERRLNASPVVRECIGRPVKLFNLSQPGNLVLNQMVNHLIFGVLLKPHMAISHNAVNDLATLQMNDPNLVSNYAIGYPDMQEAWGRKLHDAHDVEIDYLHADPARADFAPAQVRAGPEAVLFAYHLRMKQFCALCENAGIHFVNGFQPWITSKAALSKEETHKLAHYNPYYQPVYRNVPELYALYRERYLATDPVGEVADLEAHFRGLDGATTHFGDVCHLLEPGNEVCAGVYAATIEHMLVAASPPPHDGATQCG